MPKFRKGQRVIWNGKNSRGRIVDIKDNCEVLAKIIGMGGNPIYKIKVLGNCEFWTPESNLKKVKN